MKYLDLAIRTNGSARLGLGHVRRCLTLAQSLTQLGATVRFILNDDPLVRDWVGTQGFEVTVVEADRDLEQTQAALERWGVRALVTDSYDFDGDYLNATTDHVPLRIAVDDLADRDLPVEMIVNGAANASELSYPAVSTTRLLLGPAYILLRDEFAQEPSRVIRGRVQRVLVTVGGSDPFGLTPLLARWVIAALGNVELDLVVGPFFENTSTIERLVVQHPDTVRMHCNPPDMRGLMLNVDMAVTGGGQTTYELAATGTPAVAICLAENQRGNLTGLTREGTLIFVGDADASDLGAKLVCVLKMLASSRARRLEMSTRGRQVVDGLGARRVALAITEEYRANRVGPL